MKNTKIKTPLFKLSAILLIVVLFVLSARRTEAAQTSFPDVADNAWYRDAVSWAIDEKVTSGRGGYYLPDTTCTRAEAVTFLYNYAGRPSVKANISFADVKSSSLWYYNAVAWAVNNKITSGYGTVDGKPIFSPDTVCSRAMIVTMLRNYAEHIDNCYKPSQGAARSFPDVRTGQWYYESVSWASEFGVANGKGDGRFHPNDSCTRAQIVTFIYNYRMRVAPGHVHNWVTETIVDKPAWDETVKVRDAYDEQVLVRDAWDEQVKTKDAWDETVKVRDAWDEQVEVEGAWDEPVYDEFYVCARCGFMTQNSREIGIHCGDAHEAEGGARYSVEPVATGEYIHHDAVYETVHHDTEYTTIHHDAEYMTVHHDAEYTTVHHDAEYTTVHHAAETHTVTRCTSCGAVK